MHLNLSSFCVWMLLGSSVVTTVLADTKLTYTDSGFGPQDRKTVIQINGDKIRMEEAGSGIYSLYDDSKKVLYTVNTKTKQYIETTPEKIRTRMLKLAETHDKLKEDIQKQIAQLPEAQRKVAQARMAEAEAAMKAPPPAIKLEKTQRTDTINGLPCTISTISMADKPVRDVCVATGEPIPTADEKRLVTMFEFMDTIAAESAKAQGYIPPNEGSATLHKNGLALRIQSLPTGPRSELTQIGKEELNDADFNIPADFAMFEPADTQVPSQEKTPSSSQPAASAPAPVK